MMLYQVYSHLIVSVSYVLYFTRCNSGIFGSTSILTDSWSTLVACLLCSMCRLFKKWDIIVYM